MAFFSRREGRGEEGREGWAYLGDVKHNPCAVGPRGSEDKVGIGGRGGAGDGHHTGPGEGQAGRPHGGGLHGGCRGCWVEDKGRGRGEEAN